MVRSEKRTPRESVKKIIIKFRRPLSTIQHCTPCRLGRSPFTTRTHADTRQHNNNVRAQQFYLRVSVRVTAAERDPFCRPAKGPPGTFDKVIEDDASRSKSHGAESCTLKCVNYGRPLARARSFDVLGNNQGSELYALKSTKICV